MRCVLITGAAGFIGGAAVGLFVEEGWHVLALVHRRVTPDLERLAARKAITLLRGDAAEVTSFKADLMKALGASKGTLDAIVHAAGRASDVGRAALFRRSHVESARALAGLARELGVGRLVLVSTTDVYGLLDFQGEDEEALPLRAFPDNPYPRHKIEAEAAVRRELPPAQWAIIRPAAVWGAGDRTLTPRIVAFLRSSPWIVHFGRWRGRNRWPLAHVRNVAQALFLAAVSPRAGLTVNVLDDEVTTMDEFYRLLASIYLPGKTFKTVCLPFWVGQLAGAVVSRLSTLLNLDRPFADPSYYALYSVSRNLHFSNRRMRELFAEAGRRPVSREEGLKELA
jgi:nucleoside-diphosphate-sugar epimerase